VSDLAAIFSGTLGLGLDNAVLENLKPKSEGFLGWRKLLEKSSRWDFQTTKDLQD
jgi:hypothetical protein